LDRNAQIEPLAFEYFPMWTVRASAGEKERVWLKPAAALSVSELEQLTILAADLEPYHQNLDAKAVTPTVPYDTMRQWLADDFGVKREAVREAALVHVPIYRCKYVFDGRRYTAIVDGATGKVFANIYPSKWETPYRTVAAVTFAAYLCAAFIPIIGYQINAEAGLATGVLVYGVVVAVLAVIFFAAAAAISSKV
jgi:hypothetical protein